MKETLEWVLANQDALWQLVLALFTISSLVVGMTKTDSDNKVVEKVKHVLNWFSLVVHKDSPGSLKLPIVQSKPPEPKEVKFYRVE